SEPSLVAVANYFGENIAHPRLLYRSQPIFRDPRLLWAVRLGDGGRILPNRFARTYGPNSGLIDFASDHDGVLRRFSFVNESVDHLGEQIVELIDPDFNLRHVRMAQEPPTINFRGP